MHKEIPTKIGVLAIIAFAVAILVLIFLRSKPLLAPTEPVPPVTPPVDEPRGCTMEAKICPDGSMVGRRGPHCEFDPCP